MKRCFCVWPKLSALVDVVHFPSNNSGSWEGRDYGGYELRPTNRHGTNLH